MKKGSVIDKRTLKGAATIIKSGRSFLVVAGFSLRLHVFQQPVNVKLVTERLGNRDLSLFCYRGHLPINNKVIPILGITFQAVNGNPYEENAGDAVAQVERFAMISRLSL